VADFANNYAAVVGQPSSVSQITLSGLGDTALQNVVSFLGTSGRLLNIIYQIYLWARNYIATKQAIEQSTANANLLNAQNSAINQYNSLVASGQGNSPAATALLTSIKGSTATGPAPPAPVPLTAWFENNTWIIALLVGAAVAIPVIKKL